MLSARPSGTEAGQNDQRHVRARHNASGTVIRWFLTMRRKRPGWRQPPLFPTDPGDSPEPQKSANIVHHEGDHHAVQDDHPRTSGSATQDERGTPAEPEAASDAGVLRQRTEGQPRRLEGSPPAGEAGERPEPDRQRSDGARLEGPGGSFALRVESGRHRSALPRSGNGASQPSYVARLKASRQQRSLFDVPPNKPPPQSKQPNLDPPPPATSDDPNLSDVTAEPSPSIASGEKAKARDIIAAIRTLKRVETERRPPNKEEKEALARFSGFGPVALSIFPDPVTGNYKDAGWQSLGDELKTFLTPREYDSAKRTTFNAFYTSSAVIAAIHEAIGRLGVPDEATILEPGCGIGNFMSQARQGTRFIGVELDSISGRIAKALHPEHDVRIENFRDTRLPEGSIDAAIGNVPFADLKLDYRGQKLSLHDFFFAKSVDALKPGGVLALVTSHYTLDKQNAAIREYLSSKADFVGAIRLPSDAFKREGTAVVTDILFLRKRVPGEPANHLDPEWLGIAPLSIQGAEVSINRYFLNHPEMVLGQWSRKDTLYGGEGYSVTSSGDLSQQLKQAIQRLPEFAKGKATLVETESAQQFTPPPPERHITEGSFFVGDDRIIYQSQGGQGIPVVYGGATLRADGTMTGKRLATLIELRNGARRVLQSQNEGWPDANRNDARRDLNRAYDRFVISYGPINKTTFGETSDGNVIRRMPNLVKFREDPDGMLVSSLEDYDEVTGKATKAAIMTKDVVGKTPPITQVQSAEEGLLVSLNQHGTVDLPFIATLYGKPEQHVIAKLGDLIFLDPESDSWQTADAYLSGDVRAKLKAAERAGSDYAAQCRSLEPRAARGCAARRHRRPGRRALDTGIRHPGLCRRIVPRRFSERSGRAS